MIVILYQHGCGTFAKKAATDLRKAFANSVKVGLIGASSSSSWPGDVSWDDLLIVMYGGKDFPAKGNAFIDRYLKKRGSSAILLPVAVDLSVKKPPKAAAAIKALQYDPSARGPKGRLVNRVGGMLGLLVHGRDAKIFISYRASDGTAIAKQLHDHLVNLGHNVFLR
jgi:hypothetical protein